jgi:hypothetical protein
MALGFRRGQCLRRPAQVDSRKRALNRLVREQFFVLSGELSGRRQEPPFG